MRGLLFVFVFFLVFVSGAAQDKLLFSYDTAGNQVRRELVCINCAMRNFFEEDPNVIAKYIKEDELDNFLPKEVPTLTYFPNPVREELHIEWENVSDVVVDRIEVFSMGGQHLGRYINLSRQTQKTISFHGFAAGIYSVQLFYSDGTKKSVNIIKK